MCVANSSITRGHNLKLSRLTCRSRVRHDYFSQRIVEYWNSLPSDVVNASSVNSFKGRLDKHWKDFMFTLELPPRTVTYCHWCTDRQKATRPMKPQKMVNGVCACRLLNLNSNLLTHSITFLTLYTFYCVHSSHYLIVYRFYHYLSSLCYFNNYNNIVDARLCHIFHKISNAQCSEWWKINLAILVSVRGGCGWWGSCPLSLILACLLYTSPSPRD